MLTLALSIHCGCDAERHEPGDVRRPQGAHSTDSPLRANPWKRECGQGRGVESFCVRGRTDGGDQVFEAGATVEVRGAIALGCVSSSHHKVASSTCTLQQDGEDVIRVQHDLCMLRKDDDGGQTADCLLGGGAVGCSTPPLTLEKGSYTISWGSHSVELKVPSRGPSGDFCSPRRMPPKPKAKPKAFRPGGL